MFSTPLFLYLRTVTRIGALQVGVDGGWQLPQLKRLAYNFIQLESALDLLMPKSRRHNTNRYCRSNVTALTTAPSRTKQQALQLVQSANGTPQLQQLLCPGESRYMKMNLMALNRHGTVEFRHAGGSKNPAKVWYGLLELRPYQRELCILDSATLLQSADAPQMQHCKRFVHSPMCAAAASATDSSQCSFDIAVGLPFAPQVVGYVLLWTLLAEASLSNRPLATMPKKGYAFENLLKFYGASPVLTHWLPRRRHELNPKRANNAVNSAGASTGGARGAQGHASGCGCNDCRR